MTNNNTENNVKIECHDCAKDLELNDVFNEIKSDDIEYCPFCGSKNIEVYK